VKLFPVENRSCTTGIAAISPTLSPFGDLGSWERKKRLRVPPEVSHERAEPLGINVRVASGGCQALMAQQRLVAQVGSALVDSGQTRIGHPKRERQKVVWVERRESHGRRTVAEQTSVSLH
jgi:hypothetical protein